MEENNNEIQKETLRLRSGKEKKTDFYIELALFLILGILIGIAVKTEAMKRITIGFDDYKMKFYTHSYDLNKMQADAIQKDAQAQAEQNNFTDTTNADQNQSNN